MRYSPNTAAPCLQLLCKIRYNVNFNVVRQSFGNNKRGCRVRWDEKRCVDYTLKRDCLLSAVTTVIDSSITFVMSILCRLPSGLVRHTGFESRRWLTRWLRLVASLYPTSYSLPGAMYWRLRNSRRLLMKLRGKPLTVWQRACSTLQTTWSPSICRLNVGSMTPRVLAALRVTLQTGYQHDV